MDDFLFRTREGFCGHYASAFVTLTYLKVIPFWIAVVVVSRDLILSVGVLVIHVAGGTVHPTPSWLGKASTLFQMGTVLTAMLAYYFKTLVFLPKTAAWITALFTVGSGLQYLVQGLKQLNPPDDPAGQAQRSNLEHGRLR